MRLRPQIMLLCVLWCQSVKQLFFTFFSFLTIIFNVNSDKKIIANIDIQTRQGKVNKKETLITNDWQTHKNELSRQA